MVFFQTEQPRYFGVFPSLVPGDGAVPPVMRPCGAGGGTDVASRMETEAFNCYPT